MMNCLSRMLALWALLFLVTASSAADQWSIERLAEAKDYSQTIDTAAVVILQDGKLVDQWGAVAMPLNCHSIRKSLLSAMFGQHVQDGIVDLDETLGDLGIDDNEPPLTEIEKTATVRDLLMARSGVYHPALYETASMAAKRPKRGTHAPGTFWYYNNWDFNTLGTIFRQQTGRDLFDEFNSRIAEPLGMLDFRPGRDTEYVSGKDSIHRAYPFQLSARDLARFGQLMLQNGRWNGQQLVPETWVRESTQSYSDAGKSGGYGYMWWVAVDGEHLPGVTLPAGSYSGRGYRGHYLVIIPEWNLVVCHRVNTHQSGTVVSSSQFGKLLSLILAARTGTTEIASNDSKELPKASEYSIIIRNGEIIDGTGRNRFSADVGIVADRIAEIGDLSDATADRIIDATGQIVCPGFIDLHSHAEEGLVHRDPARRSAPNLITQGITTVVVNQDGDGPLDMKSQRESMQQSGIGLNVVQALGHGTLRRKVLGDDYQRPASPEEIETMQGLLRSALKERVFGMSAGLEYVPGRWSTAREMHSLAQTIKEFDGVYIVHERSSGTRPMWFLPSRDSHEQPSMVDNIRELIAVAADTRVTTVATHIKARGTDFWGSSETINSMIRKAREEGLPLFADQYPYNTSGSDGRIVLIPDWVFAKEAGERDEQREESDNADSKRDFAKQLESVLQDEQLTSHLRKDVEYEITRRGGAEKILIIQSNEAGIAGKTLGEYAEMHQEEPVDAVFRLQLMGDRHRRGGAQLRAFSMDEADVEAFAATAWTATSSDAGIALPHDGPVHPRFYGAFPRKIRHYAIDRGLMSVEEAVRVSTSLPAMILGLIDRGELKTGFVADLVVFDPETVRDRSDAFHPHRFAEGISYVLINGSLSVDHQQWYGNLSGQVILKSQRDPVKHPNSDDGNTQP
ncbi:serine hydrolase [Stieleria varia]|uniref:N-acyl-D-glutamate deacylase n=1 Tax=Stieleria varia TaxID=2528005 RepID=A0A5C6A5U6_9BACT|nr:serine hydrolase [Stieleria varia]TWT94697.1 N-acyl-D-glutamate deacylase [Stieleria varia]